MFKSLSSSAVSGDSTRSGDSGRSKNKAVSFGLIQVREYNCVVGDNPAVRVGPPVSIGWEFVQNKDVPVDVYEKTNHPRKSGLRMSNFTRKSLLREACGVSREEIKAAENGVQKIQRQRCQTIQQGKTATAIEYAMESAKRKMYRLKRTKGILPIQKKVCSQTA
jgi:hypothetical protein